MRMGNWKEQKFWQCTHCGTRHETPSIELTTVTCKCGVGHGVWAVVTVVVPRGNHGDSVDETPLAKIW